MKYNFYKLGDICSMVKGESPTMKTLEGKYPLVVTAAYRRTANTYQIDGEAVCIPLVSSTGHGDAAIHRVHYQNGKFALANLLVALLPKDPSICNAKYLYHLLMTKKDEYLVSLMRGTANVSLKEQDIYNVEISLPPVEEQRRIVVRIEEFAGKIAEARGLRERSIEETKLLLDAALKYIFDKPSALSAIQLSDVAEINRGKFAHRPRNDPRFYNGNIPFIQIGDISNSPKYIREYSQTLNDEGLKVSRIFPCGTIVIAITGATIGATGILTFESCFPDSIVGINSKSDKVTTEYIYWSLEYIKKDMLSEATQTTQPNINLQHFAKLRIVVPPLPEQQQTVEYLDKIQFKIDTLKQLRQESLKELDALLPAILDKAFKGEL
jgi:type I restriction enzyme, S subunit